MARLTVQYNCGCGYLTRSLEAATVHSDAEGHDMSIHGIIKTEKPPVPYVKKPIRRTVVGRSATGIPVTVNSNAYFPEVAKQAEVAITSKYDALKARLTRKV
jgi:hypothetical protein